MKSTLILIRLGLLAVMISALASCGGNTGATGAAGAPGTPGTPGTSSGGVIKAINMTPEQWQTAQLSVDPASISVTINSAPVVKFRVTDDKGNAITGLDSKGATNLDNMYFTLAKLVPGAAGSNNPSVWRSYLVTKLSTSTTAGAVADNGKYWLGTYPTSDREGTLVDDGDGNYTYTFARDISHAQTVVNALTDDSTHLKADLGDVSYDATATTRLGIVIRGKQPGGGTVNMVTPGNVIFDFVPNGGTVTGTRTIVQRSSCDSCHQGQIIGHGDRRDPNLCVTCHTDQTKYGFVKVVENTNADGSPNLSTAYKRTITDESAFTLPRMIHQTHMGKELVKTGYNLNGHCNPVTGAGMAQCLNTVGFPQNPANCTTCHDGSATKSDGSVNANKTPDGDNWKNVPSIMACGSCHDGIDFTKAAGAVGSITLADKAYDLGTVDTLGNPKAVMPVGTTHTGHLGGQQTSNVNCQACHTPGTTVGGDVEIVHRSYVPSLNNPVVKAGLHTFEYKISGATINASNQVEVTFQVLEDGSAVALPIAGFTGGPSFVVAYGTAQDGLTQSSDWNSKHDSATLGDLVAGANGNILSAPGANNTYTATLASSSVGPYSSVHTLTVPADAKMVTVMMAGAYSDGTTSVPGIPAMMAATGTVVGQTTPNVARRVIFSEAKCDTCHDRLGTVPNFHGGSYSIAMCAACHTPLQGGNTGWSASFRVWVHGIHSAAKRTVPFTWHKQAGFDASEIGYPGKLNNCEACHLPGTYDFSASQYTQTDAVGKTIVDYMPNVTAATNNRGAPIALPSDVPPQYPKVNADGTVHMDNRLGSGYLAYGLVSGVNYGSGLGINAASGVIDTSSGLQPDGITVTAAKDNLVTSPITAVCSTCHDSLKAIDHMKVVGYGSFYRNRAEANNAPKEQCLSCHSSGVVAIATVHK